MRDINISPFRLILLCALLLAGIHGIGVIPFVSLPAIDFRNLYVFHHGCPEWPAAYLKTGQECGDPLNRPIVYPPLMYWSFVWTRWFSFETATLIWRSAIVLLTAAGMGLVWRSEPVRSRKVWLPGALLFVSMPMVYALERGNNDAWVVLVWSIAVWAYARERRFLAGALMAAAAWLKVYPTIALFVVAVAAFDFRDVRNNLRFWAGAAVGFFVIGLAFFADHLNFLTHTLPAFMHEGTGYRSSSHEIYRGASSWLIKVPILAVWIVYVRAKLARDPVLALSGALAISTFFPNVSNDYNFITAFPFLLLLCGRALRTEAPRKDFLLLLFTLAVFVGDRWVMDAYHLTRANIYLAIVWLLSFPALEGRWIGRDRPDDQRGQG